MHWFSLMFCILSKSIWWYMVSDTADWPLNTASVPVSLSNPTCSKLNLVQCSARTYFPKCNSACLKRRWCSATGDRQFINYFSALSLKWYIKDFILMEFGSGASFPLFRTAVTQACSNFLGIVCVAEHKLCNRISQSFVTGPKCYVWNNSILYPDSLAVLHEKDAYDGISTAFLTFQLASQEAFPLQNLQPIDEKVWYRCLLWISICSSRKHLVIHIGPFTHTHKRKN